MELLTFKKRKKVISVLRWKSKGCNFVIFSHLSTAGRMEVVLPLDRILTTCQSDISRCPSGFKKKNQPFSHYFSPSELRVSSFHQPEMKNSGNNLFFNNWISDCLSPPLYNKRQLSEYFVPLRVSSIFNLLTFACSPILPLI